MRFDSSRTGLVESEEMKTGDTGDSRTLRPNLHRFKSKVLLDSARDCVRCPTGRKLLYFVLTT